MYVCVHGMCEQGGERGGGAFEHTTARTWRSEDNDVPFAFSFHICARSAFTCGAILLAPSFCCCCLVFRFCCSCCLLVCFRLGSCNLTQANFQLVVPLASVSEVLELLLWDIMCYF